MPRKSLLAATLLAVAMAFAVLPASPAAAVYQYKYGQCGAFKSGVRGFLALTYDYSQEGVWEATVIVHNRKSSINTYGCTDLKVKTIDAVRVKSTVRVGGFSISSCEIGTGGGSCTGTTTARTYTSGWRTASNKSNMVHTVSRVEVSGDVIYSLTNRIDGNWVAGSQDYDDYFDYYCDRDGGKSSCEKRNG